MERLTERWMGCIELKKTRSLMCNEVCEENGNCKGCPINEAFNHLSEYEDLGLTPAQLQEVDKQYSLLAAEHGELKKELEEYKRLEQDGRLHIVPDIKVHKTLYWIWGNGIMPVKYCGINGGYIDNKGEFHITCKMKTKKERVFKYKRGDIVTKAGDERYFYADEINKTVFLTREAAEAALAEMEGRK